MELISTRPEVENCPRQHFSIRAYVSNMRKVDPKKCWPFPFEEKVETLPPMRVPTYNYWKCKENEENPNPPSSGLMPDHTCSDLNDEHAAASMLLACSERAYRESLKGKMADARAPINGSGAKYGPEEPPPLEKNLRGQRANVEKSKLLSVDIINDCQYAVKERNIDGKTTDAGPYVDSGVNQGEIQEIEADFVAEREDMYPPRDDELAAIKNSLLKDFEQPRDTAKNTKGKGKHINDSKIRRPRSKRPGVTKTSIIKKAKKPTGKTVLPTVFVINERSGVIRKNVRKAKPPAGKTVSPRVSEDERPGVIKNNIRKAKPLAEKTVSPSVSVDERPGVIQKNTITANPTAGKTVSSSVSVDERPGVTRRDITKANPLAGKTVSPSVSVDGLNRDSLGTDYVTFENDHVSLENEASNSRGNTRRIKKVRFLGDILKAAPLHVCENASNEENVVEHDEKDSESSEETCPGIVGTGCDSNADGVADLVETRFGSNGDAVADQVETGSGSDGDAVADQVETGAGSNADIVADQAETGSGSNGNGERQTGSGSNGQNVIEIVEIESDDEPLGFDLNLSPTHQELRMKKRKFVPDEESSEINAAKKLEFAAAVDDQRLSSLKLKAKMREYEERDSFLVNQQGESQGHLRGTESPIATSQVSNRKLPSTSPKKDDKARLHTGGSSLVNQLEKPTIPIRPNILKKQNSRKSSTTSQQAVSGESPRHTAETLATNLHEEQRLSDIGNKTSLPETMTKGVKRPDQVDKAEEARRNEILRCLAEDRSRNCDKTQSRSIQPPEYVSRVNCRPPLHAPIGLQFPGNPSVQSQFLGRNFGYENSMYPGNQVAPLSINAPFLFGQNPPFSKVQETPCNPTQLLGSSSRTGGNPNSLFMPDHTTSAAITQYLAANSNLANQDPRYSRASSWKNSYRGDRPGWTPINPNYLSFGKRNPNSANRNSQYLELFPNGSAHPLQNPLNNNKNLDMGTSKRLYPSAENPLTSQLSEMQLNPQSIRTNNWYDNGNMTATQMLSLAHAGLCPSQRINLETAAQKLSFPPSMAHLNQSNTTRLMQPPPSKYINRNGARPTVGTSAPPEQEIIDIEKEKVDNLPPTSHPLSIGKRKEPEQDSVNGVCNENRNPAEIWFPEYMIDLPPKKAKRRNKQIDRLTDSPFRA